MSLLSVVDLLEFAAMAIAIIIAEGVLRRSKIGAKFLEHSLAASDLDQPINL
jgi:hypothetical protein